MIRCVSYNNNNNNNNYEIKNENNNNKDGPSDEVLKNALKNQVQTKFDDIEISHILETTNPDTGEKMDDQHISIKNDGHQLRDFGLS